MAADFQLSFLSSGSQDTRPLVFRPGVTSFYSDHTLAVLIHTVEMFESYKKTGLYVFVYVCVNLLKLFLVTWFFWVVF